MDFNLLGGGGHIDAYDFSVVWNQNMLFRIYCALVNQVARPVVLEKTGMGPSIITVTLTK